MEKPGLSVNSAPWTRFMTGPMKVGRSFIPFGVPTRPVGLVVMGARHPQLPVDPDLGPQATYWVYWAFMTGPSEDLTT